ncbi:hypothetical protein U1Q18_046163 [Sarracenia purpurea var. burkii]
MVSNTRDKDASPETIICLESAILLRVDMEEVKGFFTVKLIKTSIFHVVQGLQWLLATAERLESELEVIEAWLTKELKEKEATIEAATTKKKKCEEEAVRAYVDLPEGHPELEVTVDEFLSAL